MVEPATTPVPVGDVETTRSEGGGAVDVAAAGVLRRWTKATSPPAAISATTATTATSTTHSRGRLLERAWSGDDMASTVYPCSAGQKSRGAAIRGAPVLPRLPAPS